VRLSRSPNECAILVAEMETRNIAKYMFRVDLRDLTPFNLDLRLPNLWLAQDSYRFLREPLGTTGEPLSASHSRLCLAILNPGCCVTVTVVPAVVAVVAAARLHAPALSRPLSDSDRESRTWKGSRSVKHHRQSNLCDNKPFGGEENQQQWLP
jgi:hypothetical protein